MLHQSTVQKQQKTAAQAQRHRTEWTESELLALIDLAEVSLEHAALVLGRTYFAVLTAHSLLLRGHVFQGDPRQPEPAYRGWVEGMDEDMGLRLVS